MWQHNKPNHIIRPKGDDLCPYGRTRVVVRRGLGIDSDIGRRVRDWHLGTRQAEGLQPRSCCAPLASRQSLYGICPKTSFFFIFPTSAYTDKKRHSNAINAKNDNCRVLSSACRIVPSGAPIASGVSREGPGPNRT